MSYAYTYTVYIYIFDRKRRSKSDRRSDQYMYNALKSDTYTYRFYHQILSAADETTI